MKSRNEFSEAIGNLDLSHTERAVAFLWYYRQTQQFEERTPSELATDLHDEGFPKPNVTRLTQGLSASRYVVKGHRKGTFQIDVRRIIALEEKYGSILKVRKVEVSSKVIPSDWFVGAHPYLERLAHQINGCYEYGFYDGCAVLCRRLMESLIIDIYISSGRHNDIQNNRIFLPLDKLISHIRSDGGIPLGRNTPKTMVDVKQLGDTAAHDRVYITDQSDIDDIKARYRRMIRELMNHAGI